MFYPCISKDSRLELSGELYRLTKNISRRARQFEDAISKAIPLEDEEKNQGREQLVVAVVLSLSKKSSKCVEDYLP